MGGDQRAALKRAVGPLDGVRVIEIESIGPGPFAAMMLADMGAEVLRIQRPDTASLLEPAAAEVVYGGRPALVADLKDAAGCDLLLSVVEVADALIEGFRPGVMERLGLGPEEVLARNPSLVYGRITGYGQDGPLATAAGHDINYLALSGVLSALARQGERPLFPLNLLGDYGGGGMLLGFGVVCALFEARRSGRGQVVDASMVDGTALLSTAIHGLITAGSWNPDAGTNIVDSGAHFYEVYETADGGHVAVGAIEPQFYAALLRVLDVDPAEAPQWDRSRWPALKERFAAAFRSRTRDDWARLAEGTDACLSPVLGLREAATHPHNVARRTFVGSGSAVRPAPAPRFSRTSIVGRVSDRDAGELLAAWKANGDAGGD